LNGTYFSTHYASDDTNYTVRNFVTKYKERYNEVPDAMGAAQARRPDTFDAINRAGSADGPRIRDALAATRLFRSHRKDNYR
jgi:branched-chain amino acid transport system substrate-binding protein